MNQKKGQGLSLNVIVIAIIVLVVLVVLILVFTGNLIPWNKSLQSCETKQGQCSDSQCTSATLASTDDGTKMGCLASEVYCCSKLS